MAKRWSWIPDAEQELLLRAALDEGPEALSAWRRWRRGRPLASIDNVGHQVLPLVYRNLSALEPENPDLGLLRGVYRYTWSRNKLLMHMGSRALGLFEEAGIETVLIKGAAMLATGIQPDAGARPMTDFDVMVPNSRAHDAISALEAGFSPHPDLPHPHRRVAVHHSAPFVDGAGNELDLHWYALNRSSPDDDFWAASAPLELAGRRARAPDPTDQLLQCCVHGAVWSPSGPLRWIADAITITRACEGGLDWDRLAFQAEKRRLTLTVGESLAYLRDTFGTPVPSTCLQTLRATSVPLSERATRRALRSQQTPVRMLVLHWDRYRRLKRLDPSAPRHPSFPAQMRSYWGDDNYADFSRHALRYLLGAGR